MSRPPGLTRRRFLQGLSAAGLAAALPGCSASRRGSPAGGPYLQDVRPDRATVAAVTRGGERLRLAWSPAPGSVGRAGEAVDPDPVQVHGLVARDLSPGSAYAYRLEDERGRALGEGTFRTAPPPGDAGPVTFVALGDSGGTAASSALGELGDDLERSFAGEDRDENQQARVAAAVLGASRPDLVLHTGDVVYPSGAAEDYAEALFRPFAGLIAGVPLYPTLGNHDVKSGGGRPYLENFFLPEGGPDPERRAYGFQRGPAHFVSLDVMSSSIAPGSDQLLWLEEELGRSEATWKVVFFHVPPHGPSRHGDNEQLKADLVPLLERSGVDLVLSGHDHVYARYLPIGGATYVVTGGGGKSLYEVVPDPRLAYAESVFHFVEGVIEGKELRLRAVDARGVPFDSTTLRK